LLLNILLKKFQDFHFMKQEIKSSNIESKFEWGCRIMLTVCFFRVLSGYIVFIQTYYQLVSPLIPNSVTYEISQAYMTASLFAGLVFLIALWFYFFKKRVLSLVTGGLSLLIYELLSQLLVH